MPPLLQDWLNSPKPFPLLPGEGFQQILGVGLFIGSLAAATFGAGSLGSI